MRNTHDEKRESGKSVLTAQFNDAIDDIDDRIHSSYTLFTKNSAFEMFVIRIISYFSLNNRLFLI